MSATSDLLFAYLRNIFYASPDAKLDIEKLEEDYVTFAKGLMFFAHCFAQYNDFANALARGDLSFPPPPPENELASPLKSLQASLKHLTWQSQQVAKGDYKQRVDFMGEFAESFNVMVEQLNDRQQKLEDEINVSQKHAKALEQSNLLLLNLTKHIPNQIFVLDIKTRDILLFNDTAIRELENDPYYLGKLLDFIPDYENLSDDQYFRYHYDRDDIERYLVIDAYLIEWNKTNAIALVVNDVSEEKKQLKELEDYAYRDSLTRAYNRFYGMFTLNDMLDMKMRFVLIFIDLDNLKYINDVYGHCEGDEYIIRVSRHLQACALDATVCRLGGDEFMLLLPNMDDAGAIELMAGVCYAIEHDEYLRDKDYTYSVSLGIVALDEHNNMISSEVLSLADERMYGNKLERKKERKAAGHHRAEKKSARK